MADTALAVVPKAKVYKPKKSTDHPKYSDMVKAAIAEMKNRRGSSRPKILKYIMLNYKVGEEKTVNTHLKIALRTGVKSGLLNQSKGIGVSGSFRISDAAKKAPAKPKKPAATKPADTKLAVKKPADTKLAAKKSADKKVAKAKKPKSLDKNVTKAKKLKSPAKKTDIKKSIKKPATTESAPKKPKAATVKKPATKKPVQKTPKKATKK